MASKQKVKYSVWKKFGFALKGITIAFKEELHLKIHAFAALVVLLTAWYFQIEAIEWIVICLCIGLVIGLELINTALEHMMDALHPDHHPSIGKAKDMAAGAVLFISSTACIIGLVIFWPYICS